MILYDCISIKKGFSDFQSVFMTELESNHDSNPQSSISNALGVQLPKREAKILRAALFQQVWQFQQIAPSSVFRAVLDGRRTCKSPRASTHESSDVKLRCDVFVVPVHFTYCPELRRWNGGDSLA